MSSKTVTVTSKTNSAGQTITVFHLPDGETRECLGVKEPAKLAKAFELAYSLPRYERNLLLSMGRV